MSFGLPRRAQAGVAAGVALTFLVMASSPALADHVRNQEWWLRTLHVTRAWRSTQGAGVTVALLDTGVDAKQADLAGSVITGPDYTHSGRTSGGAFWGLHGTAMASIIAGHGHGAGNTAGIMGVAPKARILSVRVTLESNDPLLTDATVAAGLPNAIARGIRYAVRHHAAVIDLPLDPVTTPGAAGSGGSRAERAAVAYASARHVVLVAPAGDGGAGSDAVNFPAAYPGVIAVGAFNEKFIKAPYSSHRPYVTLTAAGDGVTAANGLTRYAQVHSTSAASAVVAGIVALIKAQFPKLTPAQVRQVLATSTVYRPKGGRNDGSGYGTVDAAAALMAASKMVEAVPAAATGASAAAQAPPSAPAVHSTVVAKNLGHSLITDAAIAVVVFLVLLGAILGFTSWRRRQARSARLAAVRAATQVPLRKTGKPAAKGKPGIVGPGPVISGNAMGNGGSVMGNNPAWTPAGNPMAGAGLSGGGFTGSGTPGTGFTGAGTPGARISGNGPPGAADGHAAGRATPQIEPVGFVPAPPVPGAEPPGYFGAGSSDRAPGPAGGAPEDPGADGTAPVNAPPWAPIQADPGARFRGGGSAAIPNSAFPGPAAGPEAELPGDPGDAGAGRAGSRRAQGTHRGPPRAPQVSGRPPWEPAPQPDSELPWTQAPAPPPRTDVRLPQRQVTRPELPTWEAIAEEAWPGGPRGAKPHPPAAFAPEPPAGPAGDPSGPAGPAGPLGPPARPAGPQADGRPQTGQPVYSWNPDTTAEPPGAALPGAASSGAAAPGPASPGPASPKPGFGFLRGARPTGTTRPAGTAPTRPGSAPASAGGAGTPLPGAGPAGFGTAGAAPSGPGFSGAGPAGFGTADTKPKTGVPPWEITDSFMTVRTESPGATRGDGSFPTAPTAPAVPDENTGFPPGGGSFPTQPAEPPRGSGGGDLFSRSTDAPSFPSGGGSFPSGGGSFPSGGGSFPSGGESFPSSGGSFPSSTTGSSGLPRREPSFPSATSGFPSGGGSFPSTPSEPPSSSRTGSFPGTPGTPSEPPSLPRRGSFPGGSAQPPGFPRATPPGGGTADSSGASTENIPAVAPPTGDRKLPRRIPLSERTSGFPPVPQLQQDDDAFRLFPFGKNTETPPATSPSENSED